MYKLFSERIKNKDGEPEVYIYDKFPEEFRNQVYYIMSDVLDKYEGYNDSLCDYMHDTFSREKGLKKLGPHMDAYKKAGHGQGSATEPISDEFAEYALNLAATNIVLLAGIYKRDESR